MPDILKNPYVLGAGALVFLLALLASKSGGSSDNGLGFSTLSAQTDVALAKINAANQASANDYNSKVSIAQISANAKTAADYFGFVSAQKGLDNQSKQIDYELQASTLASNNALQTALGSQQTAFDIAKTNANALIVSTDAKVKAIMDTNAAQNFQTSVNAEMTKTVQQSRDSTAVALGKMQADTYQQMISAQAKAAKMNSMVSMISPINSVFGSSDGGAGSIGIGSGYGGSGYTSGSYSGTNSGQMSGDAALSQRRSDNMQTIASIAMMFL